MTETERSKIVIQQWSNDLLPHQLFGAKTESFVSLADKLKQCTANLHVFNSTSAITLFSAQAVSLFLYKYN